ncbi:MAG: hypothetical protein SVX28_00770 [Pseudomonadota bacterium]|nr:hypothetical protein [Pseudomonadota bacterium]
MAVPAALTEDRIYHHCPPEKLDFETTETLEELELPFGQALSGQPCRWRPERIFI